MKKHDLILPADSYIVYDRCRINNEKKDILISLYQGVIGSLSVGLYLSLVNDLCGNIESREYNHHHLISLTQLSMNDIITARRRLEAVGLLRTFYKNDEINNYIYVLYSPMSANEFLNHPILNVVLYNNVGKMEYDNIVSKYKEKRLVIKDYSDITCKFDDVFVSCNGYNIINNDILSDKIRSISINSNIDMDLIISGIPKDMVSDKCFNKSVCELIIYLSFIYRIDNINMQGLIRTCINEKGMIDEKMLKDSCRNYYMFENAGKLPTLIYNIQPEYLREVDGLNDSLSKVVYNFDNTSPYDFLKKCYHGSEPTNRDKKIIEDLMINQKLNPGVVNVLIDYVLKTNNMKLNKELVETIAGQWKRLNVITSREAINICKKEHKKKNKSDKDKICINNNLPEWFNKDIKSSNKNSSEIDDLLKDFN